jgi:hypothetical protein
MLHQMKSLVTVLPANSCQCSSSHIVSSCLFLLKLIGDINDQRYDLTLISSVVEGKLVENRLVLIRQHPFSAAMLLYARSAVTCHYLRFELGANPIKIL